MGRGRQKAKQTKMARKLKYMTTDTDYNELEKELSSRESDAAGTADDGISDAEPNHDAQETGAGGASIAPSRREHRACLPVRFVCTATAPRARVDPMASAATAGPATAPRARVDRSRGG